MSETRYVGAIGLARVGKKASQINNIRRYVQRTVARLVYAKSSPLSVRQKEAVYKLGCRLGYPLSFFSGGSLGDTFENDLLKLIFNATPIANIADNAASGPLTNLVISWHTADPGEAGTQLTNESTYTGYIRTNVLRNSTGWTVTGAVCNLTTAVNGAACTGGSATLTHFGIGTSPTAAGKLLMSGTLTPNIAVSNGVTPQLLTGTSITLD